VINKKNMELKDIEDFFKKVENLYIIGLFFAAVILLYITVIGVSVVFMVTDKAYSEEVETENVTKTMQDIIDRNNIIMYVLIGFLGVMILGIGGFAYNKNKNMSDAFKALTDNKFTLSVLLVLIFVMVAMNSFCKYIQDMPDKVIKQLNEDDKYKNWSKSEKSATANDELTNQGLAMSIAGSMASAIVIVLIVIFFKDRKPSA